MSANSLHKIQWGNLANHNAQYVNPAKFNTLLNDPCTCLMLEFEPGEKAVIINCFGRLRILTNKSRLMTWFITRAGVYVHILQSNKTIATAGIEAKYARSVDSNVAFEYFCDILSEFDADTTVHVEHSPHQPSICLPHSFAFTGTEFCEERHTLKYNKGCQECDCLNHITKQLKLSNDSRRSEYLDNATFTNLLVEQVSKMRTSRTYATWLRWYKCELVKHIIIKNLTSALKQHLNMSTDDNDSSTDESITDDSSTDESITDDNESSEDSTDKSSVESMTEESPSDDSTSSDDDIITL